MFQWILDYLVGMAIISAFSLWIWWTYRIEEIILQGNFSRLPQWVHRIYGEDKIEVASDGNLGCRARYWRLMPLTMFVVPNLAYLFDARRPLPFIIRLLLVSSTFLVFGLCAYYFDKKLVREIAEAR